jgi:hypothetical protein
MPSEVLLAIGFLIAITVWMALQYAIAAHRAEGQRQIATGGVACLGRVVAIQRPFMLDDCTRLYFDFVPMGTEELVRGCHITHRAHHDDSTMPLPAQGTLVRVRYLPEEPHRALITL